MNKSKILAVAFIAMMLPMVSMAMVNAQTDTSLTDVQTAGKIIIGTNAEYEPFEHRDPITNDIIGFDADIAKFIADELDVEIEWVDVDFDVLITQLSTGSFDCVIAALSVSPERLEEVDFSRWYYKSEQGVMVKADNTEITSIEDINKTTVKVGAQDGTVSADYIQGETVAEFSGFSTITLAAAALDQGSVDAVLGDYPVLANVMSTQEGKFKVVDTFSDEDFAIAVPKGSTALLSAINAALNKLLGSDIENPVPSDEYNEIYKKWFDVDAAFPRDGLQINGFPIVGLAFAVSIGILAASKKYRK